MGDTHRAQGDGEVCGTAIEATMTVSVRLSTRHDLSIYAPEFDVRGPLERASAAAAGYHATTGVADDLMVAARQSVGRMIDHLGRHHGLEPRSPTPCARSWSTFGSARWSTRPTGS